MRSSPRSIRNHCGQLPVEGPCEHCRRRPTISWFISTPSPVGLVVGRRHRGGRRVFRNTVHYLSQIHTQQTPPAQCSGGLSPRRLPDRFHPKLFLTSEFFARFLPRSTSRQARRRCRDGSGILAWRARAGATEWSRSISILGGQRADNPRQWPWRPRDRVRSDLCLHWPEPSFDVIISNPPFFPASRATSRTGPGSRAGYRDIMSLFEQAHQRLKPSGAMYVLLSSIPTCISRQADRRPDSARGSRRRFRS